MRSTACEMCAAVEPVAVCGMCGGLRRVRRFPQASSSWSLRRFMCGGFPRYTTTLCRTLPQLLHFYKVFTKLGSSYSDCFSPNPASSLRLGSRLKINLKTNETFPKEDATTHSVLGVRSIAFQLPSHLRAKRYTLTPSLLKWNHFDLTYRVVSFPRNLINESDTRRGLAAAFQMWSDISPFQFKEVPPDQESDLKIGFYPINHTDCLESLTHHCFDGTTGELAHAFFPRTGEIHFDDSEYWILGNTRFSWKKGVWLTDLVHIAAHEIGHALGLMHSLNHNALMHINATLTGKKTIAQDDLWGIYRLYGCQDRLFICPSWARKGFCDIRRRLMKKHCPYSCDFCYEFPFPTMKPTIAPPRTKVKIVPEGRNVTFRCGKKIRHKKGKIYWYKDKELLEYSYPGYLSLNEDHMSIIANAINEGFYTCLVKRKDQILTTYSWRIKVKA